MIQTVLLITGVFSLIPRAWAGPQGTTLEGTMDAFTTLTQVSTYSWNLTETAQFPNQVPFVISTNQQANIGFTITATRSGPEISQTQTPILGQTCLTNTGLSWTRGLHLKNQLEQEVSPGVWKKIYGPITHLIPTEIPPQTTFCYPDLLNVQQTIQLDPNAHYRNHGMASIDNYLGFEGMAYTIDIYAPVNIKITQKGVDASAILVDPITCHSGFNCTPSGTTLIVDETTIYPLSVLTLNQSAECGQTVFISDESTLTPVDSQIPLKTKTIIPIYTGTCH